MFSWNSQRRIASTWILVFLTGLSCFLVLRFVPPVNKALPPHPRYMSHVADRVAESLARQKLWQSAVIVTVEPREDCRSIHNASFFSDQKLFFEVTYNEQAHSFCIIEYALAIDAHSAGAITLSDNSGRNYGASIGLPVRVVPIGHVFKVLPGFVLSLMDCRVPLPSSGGDIPFDSKTEAASVGPVTDTGFQISFLEIRAALAQEHRYLNHILETIAACFFVAVVCSSVLLWRIYGMFRSSWASYACKVTARQFFREDLDQIAFRAERPEELVLYCSRHDYGTRVLQETGNLAAVMKTMGHKDVRTAMRYQHPELEIVREALNAPRTMMVQ